MTLKTEPTKVISFGDRNLLVEDLPSQAQQLLQFYDDWKQRELEARSQLMMCSTAMKSLANQIASIVQEHEQSLADVEETTEAANEGTEAGD